MKATATDVLRFAGLAGLAIAPFLGVVPAGMVVGNAILQNLAASGAYDLMGTGASALRRRFFNKLGEPNHHLNKALQQAILDALRDIDIEKEFRAEYPPGSFDENGGHAALEDYFRALRKGKAALIFPDAKNPALVAFLEDSSEETFEALAKSYPPAAFPNLPPEVPEFIFRRLHAAIAARFWDRVKNDSPTWHAYATEVFLEMRESLASLGESNARIIALLEERNAEVLRHFRPPQEIIDLIEAHRKELKDTITAYGESMLALLRNADGKLDVANDKLDILIHREQPPSHPVPHMLPPAANRYFGRTKQKEALAELLRESKDACVWGLAGMGKTALAADVLATLFGSRANALAKQLFPHGIVFLDLYLLKADPEKVWAALANSLAGPDFEKDSPSGQRASRACANRECLIIIEGAEEATGEGGSASLDHLRSVLCVQNRILILTRDRKQTVSVQTVELAEALDPEEAAALLDHHGGGSIPADVRAELLALLEGHPLALTWAGGLIGQGLEEARQLLSEWKSEKLPGINDPARPHRTLQWLYGRSTRGLSPECLRFLRGAGQLARVPFPLAAVGGALDIGDPASCAKALVGAGILRLAAEEGHREFTHILGYQFATHGTDEEDWVNTMLLARWLEGELRSALFTPGVDERLPLVTRLLQHSAALLAANPSDSSLWLRLGEDLLHEIAPRLKVLGRLGLAKASISAAADWLQGMAASDPLDANWQCKISSSHDKLGDIAVAQGDLPAAAEAYTAGMGIRKSLAARDPENTLWQRDLSTSHERLGYIARAQGDLSAAAKAYTAGMGIRRSLAAREPENTEWQRDFSLSHNSLGDIASAQGDLPAASKAYTAGMGIAETLAARDPENTEWQRDLSISHEKLGDIARVQGDLPAAAKAYTAAMEIAQALAARDPENTEWQRDLSISHNKLGDIAVAQGDRLAAKAAYTAGLEIRKTLAARDPENAVWQRDLAFSHFGLAEVEEEAGAAAEAREHYRQSHDILVDLVAKGKDASPLYMELLATLKQKLGIG